MGDRNPPFRTEIREFKGYPALENGKMAPDELDPAQTGPSARRPQSPRMLIFLFSGFMRTSGKIG
ncbi:hypothetical protein [Nitratireductor indicus]|uniref:hypothetical protein n=1 Tax=Nitratireductor indicus TaxID=721133 RepID=UPI001160C137|nr:hypothetical protein [Nitratireductor indicus]